MVALNNSFSIPRRVLNSELNPSPPNAIPSPVAERCISIATIKSTERAIWIYGNIPIIVSIGRKDSIGLKICNSVCGVTFNFHGIL